MRVLLINSQTPSMIANKEYYAPLSLLYLGAVLQAADVAVSLLDLNVHHPEICEDPREFCDRLIAEKVQEYAPDIVGFGCLFSGQFPDVLHYSQQVKKHRPGAFVVVGGIHPTLYSEEILRHCPSIDWIVVGEGEESFLHLVKTVEAGEYELSRIDGFAYRKNGTVVVNPKTRFIEDLDRLPFPAYDLVDLADYYHDTTNWHNPGRLPINASLPLLSSRSCPMQCNFCSMFMVMGKKWRSRSPFNVVDEIEMLVETYDHRHFSFMDDNLTLNKKHVLELCNEIVRRGLAIQFETPNGISTKFLDEEVLDALVQAGLVRVSLAIESGSDYIRNTVMGKHLSREQVLNVAGLTKKYKDLYVRAFFIMGVPEETIETLQDTYSLIEAIDVDKPIVSNLIPFPGTRLFQQAVRDGLFTGDVCVEQFWREPGFYFTDNKRFFIKPYKLTLEQLSDFRRRFDELIAGIVQRKAGERVELERLCR